MSYGYSLSTPAYSEPSHTFNRPTRCPSDTQCNSCCTYGPPFHHISLACIDTQRIQLPEPPFSGVYRWAREREMAWEVPNRCRSKTGRQGAQSGVNDVVSRWRSYRRKPDSLRRMVRNSWRCASRLRCPEVAVCHSYIA